MTSSLIRLDRMQSIEPVALPTGRLRPVVRLRLLVEILAAYGPLLRLLRSNDLAAMVDGARTVEDSRNIGPPLDPHDVAVRLGWIVNRVLGLMPTDGRCLIQSLVLTRLLARRSIESRLIVGVAVGDAFAAHAWVEHQTIAVLPRGRFTPLIEL